MTIHIHVGSNALGQGSKDVACFGDMDSAIEHLRHALKDLQEQYLGMCEDNMPEGCEDAWCSVASDAEAALSAIADGDAVYRLTKGQTPRLFGIRLSPPDGPDMAHWAEVTERDREECDTFEDQEA